MVGTGVGDHYSLAVNKDSMLNIGNNILKGHYPNARFVDVSIKRYDADTYYLLFENTDRSVKMAQQVSFSKNVFYTISKDFSGAVYTICGGCMQGCDPVPSRKEKEKLVVFYCSTGCEACTKVSGIGK